MEQRTQSPVTPAGAPVTSCDLDEACMEIDCEAEMDEFGATLLESSDGKDIVVHYCGLDYVERLQDQVKSEE
jgi:hypothetical protein